MSRKFLRNKLLLAAAASTMAVSCAGAVSPFAFAAESETVNAADIGSADDSEGASDADDAASETEAGIPADDWLPVGSVVTVKNFGRSFLILGRLVKNSTDGKYYDYCGCLFPDGYMGGDLYFFDQKDLSGTVSRGFEDEYELLFRKNRLDGASGDLLTASGQEDSLEAAEGTAVSGAAGDAAETADMPGSESLPAPETEDQPAPETEDQPAPETESQPVSETESAAASAEAGEAKTFTTTDNVRLRAEASTDSDIIVTIPAEREVKVDTAREPEGDWVPVIFTDSSGTDQKGWVKKDFLK